MPNELYSLLPILVLIIAPSGVTKRAHSNTPRYAPSLEPIYSTSLE